MPTNSIRALDGRSNSNYWTKIIISKFMHGISAPAVSERRPGHTVRQTRKHQRTADGLTDPETDTT